LHFFSNSSLCFILLLLLLLLLLLSIILLYAYYHTLNDLFSPFLSLSLSLCLSLCLQGINGILADEMGLGKTVQSIALLAHLAEVREHRPAEGFHSSRACGIFNCCRRLTKTSRVPLFLCTCILFLKERRVSGSEFHRLFLFFFLVVKQLFGSFHRLVSEHRTGEKWILGEMCSFQC